MDNESRYCHFSKRFLNFLIVSSMVQAGLSRFEINRDSVLARTFRKKDDVYF
jgi:hypothetical protein